MPATVPGSVWEIATSNMTEPHVSASRATSSTSVAPVRRNFGGNQMKPMTTATPVRPVATIVRSS